MKKIIFTLLISIPFLSCGQEIKREVDSKEATTTEKVDTMKSEKLETVDDSDLNIEIKEINWMSFEEALEAQTNEPRKIFMDVYTSWCGPCKQLDKYTFHDADVVDYVNENYYAVKFDAESPDPINYKGQVFQNADHDPTITRGRNSVHELSRAFKVNAYPTMLFLDETGNLITPIKGYQRPTQIEIYLKMFATNAYKEIDTNEKWTDYQATFEGEFTD